MTDRVKWIYDPPVEEEDPYSKVIVDYLDVFEQDIRPLRDTLPDKGDQYMQTILWWLQKCWKTN